MSIIPMTAPALPVRSCRQLGALASLPGHVRTVIQRRLNAQDERALERNWTITRGRWGSRTYRDPLFDLLALDAETAGAEERR